MIKLTTYFLLKIAAKFTEMFFMHLSQLTNIFLKEFSTQSVMNNISSLSQYHRIQGSLGFLEAVKNISSILETNGLNSELYEYPADGKWDAWEWTTPISWNIKSGECWLTKPVRKRLCRFCDQPMSVITHSKPADFEGLLVDVGKGDKDYDFKNAEGKIALLTGSPRRIFPYAAKHKVKGILLHPNLNRAAQIGDETVQYDGFWPVAENLSDVTSGFSLSHTQARELQQYLEEKKEVIAWAMDEFVKINKKNLFFDILSRPKFYWALAYDMNFIKHPEFLFYYLKDYFSI